MFSIPKSANAREAAYLAALHTGEGGRFAAEMLDQWQCDASPSLVDAQLARRIGYGTIQMTLSLDYLAVQLTERKHLKLKRKEQTLLQTALYQLFFMERLPAYAIGNETMRLAKKYCQPHFANFLNALLRRYQISPPTLPIGDSEKACSLRYSYPQYFVRMLKNEHTEFESLLQLGNKPATLMVRLRNGSMPNNWTPVVNGPLCIAIPSPETDLKELGSHPKYYIQNATQAKLLNYLSSVSPVPKTVMDLCAAPGGKLIAAHDLYPEAKLYGNDVSARRLHKVKENLHKYAIQAECSVGDGEVLQTSHSFDLVIVDAPCSNSGVLNKRPEARWRLTPEQIDTLNQDQFKLIKAASELITDEGTIWYITCSILNKENEQLVAHACEQLGLEQIGESQLILPNFQGCDGGFGCALRKVK